MGRASVKENKNVYQRAREAAGLTRAQASEALEWVTESRIEKIEGDKSVPTPEEALAMAGAYKKTLLCNYYCSCECAIGRKYVPAVEEKAVEAIVLELLAALNAFDAEKNRLIEITSDGVIHDDQIRDFVHIRDRLRQIASITDALTLWFDETVESGKVNREIVQLVVEENRRVK